MHVDTRRIRCATSTSSKTAAQQEQVADVHDSVEPELRRDDCELHHRARRQARQLGWAAATPAGRGRRWNCSPAKARRSPDAQLAAGQQFHPGDASAYPAGKEMAFMHLHATSADARQGMQTMSRCAESKVLAERYPAEVRRAIVNFSVGARLLGDREVLARRCARCRRAARRRSAQGNGEGRFAQARRRSTARSTSPATRCSAC